jgi:hypothetical protein
MEAHLVRTATLLMEQVAVDGDEPIDPRWSAGLRDHLYLAGRSASELPPRSSMLVSPEFESEEQP